MVVAKGFYSLRTKIKWLYISYVGTPRNAFYFLFLSFLVVY
jgi:hypothetical protein